MKRRTKIAAAAMVCVAGIGVAGAAAVGASTADDNEAPITGADLQRATDAALAATGEGRVTDTEVGDEESYYEVEVLLDDGTEVDVQLDRDFQVVGSEPEGTDRDSQQGDAD